MKKIFILSIVFVILLSSIAFSDESINSFTETAKILEADSVDETTSIDPTIILEQNVKLEITSGKYKGKIVDVVNNFSGNSVYDIIVESGDKVVIVIEEREEGVIDVYITDFMRQHYIVYLGILFIILILLIGKTKGLKAVITLSITLLAVVKVLLPLILRGANPVPITILTSIFITITTLFLVAGINTKSFSAIIGTTGGVITAGLLAYLIGTQVKLTGLSSEEAVMLMYIPNGITIDFKALLFSGIIMGALGAVMDVGMSIASSIDEIHRANPSLTRGELFKSGMNVGQDVMGTMTNTLILAYTGSSIPLLLLFMSYETSIMKILNLDIIATEVIRSLAGSIGLVVAIPITAAVASFLKKR